MIHVIATLRVHEGELETVVSAFRRVLPQIAKKTGCVEYSLAVPLETDLAGQVGYDRNDVIIIEKWESVVALKRHIADPDYQSWYQTIWPLMVGAHMQIYSADGS